MKDQPKPKDQPQGRKHRDGPVPSPEQQPHAEHPGAPSLSQQKGVKPRAMKEHRG